MNEKIRIPDLEGLMNRHTPQFDSSIFDNYKEANRLIIIGNGFDLAHGLKTSFKDFIEDYSYKILSKIKRNLHYEDDLISITSHVYFSDLNINLETLEKSKVYEKFMDVKKRDRITVERQSEFLKSIFHSIEEKSWVDIELVFFEFLRIASKTNDSKKITKVNSDLESLKKKLNHYLKEEIQRVELIVSDGLFKQFTQNISINETIPNTIRKNLIPKGICVLNFNYTSLPLKYLEKIRVINPIYIPIHGELYGDDITKQGIVFGYGDELDKDYLEFENLNNDVLFEHIKSFKYLHFDHYRKMLEFINNGPFQVHLYGHSCGLSDRTLLNTIFENENCISIKNFYYSNNGKDDYEQKSYAIARHFKNKADLRAKVVNKTKCEPMVQPKDEK
ncbi:AbiH family protein [Algoriphagus sp.]|uniref:AbiH family protein n=1 Tax=Algoriphagus sp. TaxID=1872435 RepID=UPI0027165E14|nr:AbiH family protein [Algoriphagus sp.]MDO8968798.1 AbiH family protein [Algoriphagus sp.]MDP3199284.1 AbiH family protein [Algoriphagus sp.]